MTVKILIDPQADQVPENSIRADLAWQLFLPDLVGDVPGEWKRPDETFKNWLWHELSNRIGPLTIGPEEEVIIVSPILKPSGREFLIRTCSFWTEAVFISERGETQSNTDMNYENLWIPPIVNVLDVPGKSEALRKLKEGEDEFYHLHLSPLLGAGKLNIRTYRIQSGDAWARHHSHSSREELYYVLRGKGTVRINGKNVFVTEGDLISKPIGPDISTNFVADKGESLTVLDIEVHLDKEKNAKDLNLNPDHGEINLYGEGWGATIPVESILPIDDVRGHYGAGYLRHADGTWEPKDIPGFEKREKKETS